MRKTINKIIMLAAAMLYCMTLTSCIYDYEEGPSKGKNDGIVMILDIRPLTSSSTTAGIDKEMVKSLRVIMLSNGSLEINRRYNVGPVLATNFEATYTYGTTVGEKEIYLIANEDEITNYEFTDDPDLPEKIPDKLTDLLNSFAEEDAVSISNGKGIKAVLEALYFPPVYNPDSNGDYYLPYVSKYTGYNFTDEDNSFIESTLQMYLVPVATKFYFNFINNRPDKVELSDIEIKSFNTLNFMMARLEDPYMNFEGEKLYWINWLAKISELSHGSPEYGENLNFNNQYGWINDYSMPETSDLLSKKFLNRTISIDEAQIEYDPEEENGYKVITPGTLHMGPFYMPESWNPFTFYDTSLQDDVTVQQYTLTLGLHDVSTDPLKDPLFTDIPIDNLKSLFRNTHVIITVTMNTGNMEIYAELTNWDKHHSQGYVVDTKP